MLNNVFNVQILLTEKKAYIIIARFRYQSASFSRYHVLINKCILYLTVRKGKIDMINFSYSLVSFLHNLHNCYALHALGVVVFSCMLYG